MHYVSQVAVFGPVWEECIIRVSCAAALVRCAAFSGGRAVRATMALYQHAYSERARELGALVAAHTMPTTFEHFVERMREPVPDPPPPAPHGNEPDAPPRPSRPSRRTRPKLPMPLDS